MIPATVHAALVIVFEYLVYLIFTKLGLDLGGEVVTQLAQWIVGYILSLGGLSLYNGIRNRNFMNSIEQYTPPFS
jgi:hypothetical protein